jgi:hypothetical protein
MRKAMKRVRHAEDFEQILLAYVQTCYSTALGLTHNPDHARDLTLRVLTWAWCNSCRTDCERDIKTKLLAALRERFLQDRLEAKARNACRFAGGMSSLRSTETHEAASPSLKRKLSVADNAEFTLVVW